MYLKKTILWLVALSCVLILITLPRFNRNDIGIQSITASGSRKLGDSAQYIAMTLYFRGEQSIDELRPPFTYRPLIPFIASLLPFKAMTSINIINLTAMIIALIFMYKILVWLKLDFIYCIIGCSLFVISFPTFYYTTIGYIDPALICLLIVGLYFILKKRWTSLIIILIIGAFVKETAIILILITVSSFAITRKFKQKQLLLLSTISIVFLISYYFARMIIPVNPIIGWTPSFNRLLYNMSRPRSWISFFLSFGIPGVLSLMIYRYKSTDSFHNRSSEITVLITGLIISILLFGYSMLSAHADGRFIWTSYPFSIPLAVLVIKEIKNTWVLNNK